MVNRHTIVRAGTYAAGAAFLAAGAYFTYMGVRYADPALIPDMIKYFFFEPWTVSTSNQFLSRHPNIDIVDAATGWAVRSYVVGGLISSVRMIKDHYEGIPIMKTIRQIPTKASSKVINPMREWAGRRLRANYLVALGYHEI